MSLICCPIVDELMKLFIAVTRQQNGKQNRKKTEKLETKNKLTVQSPTLEHFAS